MRKPTHHRYRFLYQADEHFFLQFVEMVGKGQATRYLDALVRFYVEHADSLELWSDPKKGEWLEPVPREHGDWQCSKCGNVNDEIHGACVVCGKER